MRRLESHRKQKKTKTKKTAAAASMSSPSGIIPWYDAGTPLGVAREDKLQATFHMGQFAWTTWVFAKVAL